MSNSTILGPMRGYTDLLDDATYKKIKRDRMTGQEFQKTPIRPSASGDCERALAYQLMQFHGKASYATDMINPELNRIFALGHSIEWHVIKQFDLMRDMFEMRYKQQNLSFAYLTAKADPSMSQWLEGSLDMVFWSEKYKCVADVKSKKNRFITKTRTDWDETAAKLQTMASVEQISESAYWANDLPAFLAELNDPFFASNFKQLNMYANATFLKERGVDHGSIIQYNKNDSRIREVRFRPSESLYLETVAKFQRALDAAAAGTPEVAEQEFELGSIKCGYCKYAAQCRPDVDTKQAFFNSFRKRK
jgi:CRISPR/Cas system-associated exonuclease Cas4 (RecB family)